EYTRDESALLSSKNPKPHNSTFINGCSGNSIADIDVIAPLKQTYAHIVANSDVTAASVVQKGKGSRSEGGIGRAGAEKESFGADGGVAVTYGVEDESVSADSGVVWPGLIMFERENTNGCVSRTGCIIFERGSSDGGVSVRVLCKNSM